MGVTRHVGLWFACLWLLVACAGNPIYGDEAVLDGSVHLVCSDTCLSRGSCRPTGALGQTTVYLGTAAAFPGTGDVSFAGLRAGTEVTILQTEMVSGVEEGSNLPLEIRFYLVDDMESGTNGWVPGFCLMRQS